MAQAVIFHYRANENLLSSLNPNTKLIALLSYTTVITTAKTELVFPICVRIFVGKPSRIFIKDISA